MPQRKRRKMKLLAATLTDDKRMTTEDKKEKLHAHTWSDLPMELLELILCQLSLQDNIYASFVCKRWRTAAISVRVLDRSPWLMYFPKVGHLHEFYDPAHRKTYFLELPELYGSRVCYSKDGWLLLYGPRICRLFFFNPFTQEMVKLPRFELNYQIVAFSSAPISSSCIIFTVKLRSPTIVAISTCHPGATKWVTVDYQNRLPFVSSTWNKIVFSKGHFYCLSLTGWLGVFSPLDCTWNVLAVPPPQCPENFFPKVWWEGKFMTVHNGDVLVIYTCRSGNPFIFKLDESNMIWEEMKTLGGVTLFASCLSSHSRTAVSGITRNSIYFSKVRFFGKRCISYSLTGCRYYPGKQCHDWGQQDPFGSIWIEPPEDISTFC